ncbi:WYL domain-containing protein [Ammoniphilus sp. YIM 78166]|uniref:WYL domain-containing protein n=1 Tax=Ammoniphilus sp. YIM 78166 TaxID=1644106 RepID=UPI00106F6FA4|nr:WYL domain-containing protein [Ammoniphilus sp. YIM 78166]
MNLFEKIFNYQILSRLEDSGTSTTTSQERAWLKSMIELPVASEALSPALYSKLVAALETEEVVDLSAAFIEKARSAEKQPFHPHLRALRQIIANQTGLQLTTKLKDGRVKEREPAFPYKLEYSMVKREWYLLWYHLHYKALLSTRLNQIDSFALLSHPLPPERIERVQAHIKNLLEQRKRTATIEVVRRYNRELSRILYAFSCFEKEVEYDDASDRYLIRITFQGNEAEYVLSKVRFLGQRVKIIEGEYLRSRMLESSTKALARYGENQ